MFNYSYHAVRGGRPSSSVAQAVACLALLHGLKYNKSVLISGVLCGEDICPVDSVVEKIGAAAISGFKLMIFCRGFSPNPRGYGWRA